MSKFTADTHKHISQVKKNIAQIIYKLIARGNAHDKSKLQSPEKEAFELYTEGMGMVEFGGVEYNEFKAKLGPVLIHHYANNPHHPEFYENGISGMSLIDLIEMLADWKSATLRTTNGDIMKSLEINSKNFQMSEQLYQILKNTIIEMEWE